MTTEIEVLKNLYVSLNRYDITSIIKLFDPEIVRIETWDLPSHGTYRGINEVEAHFYRGRETWAEGSCEPEKFVTAHDKVLVFVHVRVKLKKNMEWVEGNTVDAYTFKDEKIIEMRSFIDREEALKWAGI